MELDEAIERVRDGGDLTEAYATIAANGREALPRLLAARRDRTYLDFVPDLEGAYAAIAAVDPEPLLDLIASRDEPPGGVVAALGSSDDPRAWRTLVDLSRHRALLVRQGAVRALSRRVDDPEVRAVLAERLRDRSSNLRVTVLHALAKTRDPGAAPLLRAALDQGRWLDGTRSLVEEALQRLGG